MSSTGSYNNDLDDVIHLVLENISCYSTKTEMHKRKICSNSSFGWILVADKSFPFLLKWE